MHSLRSFLYETLPPLEAEKAEQKFEIYSSYLREQNSLFNLTAITDPHEIEIKHFLDSLSALPYVEGSLLDVGSGAGFPALPLQIVRKQGACVLVDSLRKRIDFLAELVSRLSLSDAVRCVHARIEDFPKSVLYDTVVARAVSRLPTLCEYCLPFVRIGGRFIAYKSSDAEEELRESTRALSILGGEPESVVDIHIDGLDAVRKLILIRKVKPTPAIYPRGGNKPRKSPLSAFL